MNSKSISRREVLKGGGVLIVGFSFAGPVLKAFGQDEAAQPRPFVSERVDEVGTLIPEPGDYLDPHELDSWVAVLRDGSVTVSTGRVDIGTGNRTALSQICADELHVPFNRVTLAMGDTAKAVDQGRSVSSTIPRGGQYLRQASAAAYRELLKLASARLGTPVESLVVVDGIVSVKSDPSKSVSYGELIGGRRFNVKITWTRVPSLTFPT